MTTQSGKIEAAVLERPTHDFILGCRYVLPCPNPDVPANHVSAVTRAQATSKKPKPLGATQAVGNSTPQEIMDLQERDASLTKLRELAQRNEVQTMKNGEVKFLFKKGMLTKGEQVP